MTNLIGTAYEMNARELARRIFERRVKVERDSSDERTCYFCRKKIEGEARVISINENNANSLYYLDEFCYKTASMACKNNSPGELN